MQILNIKLSIKNGGCNAGNSVGTLISKNINTNFIAKRLLSQSCTKNPISQKKTGLDSFVKDQFFNLIKKTGQIDFLTRNVPDFSLKNYRVKNLRLLMKFKNKYNQRLKINLVLLNYIYSLDSCDISWNINRDQVKQTKFNKLICALIRSKSVSDMFRNYSELSGFKQKKKSLNFSQLANYKKIVSSSSQLLFLKENIQDFELKKYKIKTLQWKLRFFCKHNATNKLNLILLDHIYNIKLPIIDLESDLPVLNVKDLMRSARLILLQDQMAHQGEKDGERRMLEFKIARKKSRQSEHSLSKKLHIKNS
jgi:hypothetical protein